MLKVPKSPVVEKFDDKNLKNETSSNLNNEQQEIEKFDINNNNINNKINNNNKNTQENLQEEQKKQFAKLVTMTEEEYQNLTKEYGEQTTEQMIEQLSLYKQAHGKSYESDYAAIKIWVTKRLEEMQAKQDKYKTNSKNVNNQKNYNQREYPPGFFESLYKNNIWR